MLDWSQCSAVDRDPEKCGGEWCFADTRMAVRFLFENLDKGATVDEFLEWFPGIEPEKIHAVLAFVVDSLAVAAQREDLVRR